MVDLEKYLNEIWNVAKETEQMLWVQHVNMLKAQAVEIILSELVYC